MRAITNITLRLNLEDQTVYRFLTYNGDTSDYCCTHFPNSEKALEFLKDNDPYFPVFATDYRLIVHKHDQIIVDKRIKLK